MAVAGRSTGNGRRESITIIYANNYLQQRYHGRISQTIHPPRTGHDSYATSPPPALRGVALDRGRLAVEEHEGLSVQHLLLVHADDDAVVHLEPLIAQLDEGD
eukprot:scaffold69261_cov63-Phaeocystis_antarctica.AAC.5